MPFKQLDAKVCDKDVIMTLLLTKLIPDLIDQLLDGLSPVHSISYNGSNKCCVLLERLDDRACSLQLYIFTSKNFISKENGFISYRQ